jgi:hypothetical protein
MSEQAYRDEVVKLAGELAAKDADAARYRWLRAYMASDNLTHDDALVAACANNNPGELDAAIDKELRK